MKIDPTLYTGRPDPNGRLEKELEVYDLLDELNIPYVRVDHEVTPSIEACQEVDRILGIDICKNLFLCNRQKTNFYLLLMPGSKPFKTKELSAQIGSARLSFAAEEYLKEYMNLTPGSVTVMGLMNDKNRSVRLLIDKDLLQMEEFGCHPCINTSSIKMKTKDMLEKFLPYINCEYTAVELQSIMEKSDDLPF